MFERRLGHLVPQHKMLGVEVMVKPEEIERMLEMRARGWGAKRIAAELGCARNTVRRYLRAGGAIRYQQPQRPCKLDEVKAELERSFLQHHGNADVVRQELEREHGLKTSLRTVQRAVRGLRRRLNAEARATVRFETAPGAQLQVDFGTRRVVIGERPQAVHVFVATLGYSRRLHVVAFDHERQSAWLDGLEATFHHFGGVTREVLFDNARAIVDFHDSITREVRFNERLRAFARHWNFIPRACAPYRARTKGKDERGVGYVKHNALAGHQFESWEALHAHLCRWQREIADLRVHGTTGEVPMERFIREERAALSPLAERPSFNPSRLLIRQVHSDACVEVESSFYSVPWRLIGETVRVEVDREHIAAYVGTERVAYHLRATRPRSRVVDRDHWTGLGLLSRARHMEVTEAPLESALLRPLQEYEAITGGGW
jgi:transposase